VTHRFSHTFQPTDGSNRGPHVRGIGALLASRLDPSTFPKVREQEIEQTALGSIGQEATPKFREHREDKPRIGEF
jgi:hypothetical protein